MGGLNDRNLLSHGQEAAVQEQGVRALVSPEPFSRGVWTPTPLPILTSSSLCVRLWPDFPFTRTPFTLAQGHPNG